MRRNSQNQHKPKGKLASNTPHIYRIKVTLTTCSLMITIAFKGWGPEGSQNKPKICNLWYWSNLLKSCLGDCPRNIHHCIQKLAAWRSQIKAN